MHGFLWTNSHHKAHQLALCFSIEFVCSALDTVAVYCLVFYCYKAVNMYNYFMASMHNYYVSRQDEQILGLWLATPVGRKKLSSLLRITHCVPVCFCHIINHLLTKLVQSIWLNKLTLIFFCTLWTSTPCQSIITPKWTWPLFSHLDHISQ